MSGNAEIELFNDNPLIIGSRTEDVLGFYQLADEWGEVVYKTAINQKSFVFSVEAPWGHGKTSLLNILKRRIEIINHAEQNPDISNFSRRRKSDGSSYILEYLKPSNVEVNIFNPWKLSDLEGILIELFKVLTHGTGIETEEKYKKFVFAILKSSLPLTSAVAEILSRPVSDTLTNFGSSILENKLSEPTLEESYKSFSMYLENSKIKKIIIIDDIDRLDSSEQYLIFKMVKMLSEVSGVTFVLSFDASQVEKVHQGSGIDIDSYLEKIIQYRFTLPKLNNLKVMDYFFVELEKVISNFLPFEHDQTPAVIVESFYQYHGVLSQKIGSLRQAKRLLNEIPIYLRSLEKSEVYILDAISIAIFKFFNKNDFEQELLKAWASSEVHVDYKKAILDILKRNEKINFSFGSYKNGGPYLSNHGNIVLVLNELNQRGIDRSDALSALSPLMNHPDFTGNFFGVISSDNFSPEKLEDPFNFALDILSFSNGLDLGNRFSMFFLENIMRWVVACADKSLNDNDLQAWANHRFNPEFARVYRVFEKYLFSNTHIQGKYDDLTDDALKYIIHEFIEKPDKVLPELLVNLVFFVINNPSYEDSLKDYLSNYDLITTKRFLMIVAWAHALGPRYDIGILITKIKSTLNFNNEVNEFAKIIEDSDLDFSVSQPVSLSDIEMSLKVISDDDV